MQKVKGQLLTSSIFSGSSPSRQKYTSARPQRSLSRIPLHTCESFLTRAGCGLNHICELRTYRGSLQPLKGIAMTTRPLEDFLFAERQALLETTASRTAPVQTPACLTCPRSSMKVSPLLKLSQLTGTSVALTTCLPLTCNSRVIFTLLVTMCWKPKATPPVCETGRRSQELEI